MAFEQRNAEHQRLRDEIYSDAIKHGYSIQPRGHENLKTPIPSKYNDDASWSIRATPDDLILYKRTTILEVKAKLEPRQNISIELRPLEEYKKNPQEIFIACETILDGGLASVKVQCAKKIPIQIILIPDREDNTGACDRLMIRYPDAKITDKVNINRGSWTPFVLIEPDVYKHWLCWDDFRNKIILEKRQGQILLDDFLD